MNKLLIALVLAGVLLVGAMPTTVSAEETSQNQKVEQAYEVECTSGSYGQSTCKVKGTQSSEQDQYIKRADGRIIRVHKPANTGVPAALIGGSALISVLGAGALIAKRK